MSKNNEKIISVDTSDIIPSPPSNEMNSSSRSHQPSNTSRSQKPANLIGINTLRMKGTTTESDGHLGTQLDMDKDKSNPISASS